MYRAWNRLAFVAIAAGAILGSAAASDGEQTLTAATSWDRQDYEIEGGWRIEVGPDGRFVVLDEGFATRRGPDVKLFLSPTAVDDVRGASATRGAVFLGRLEGFRGEQRFAIPDGVRLDEYESLLLHCERYSKLWGAGALRGD